MRYGKTLTRDGLLGGLLLAGGFFVAQRSDPDTIRARKLEILDDEGRTIVEIRGDERGGRLSLRSADGKELVTLHIDPHGGSVQVVQNNGHPGARMYVENHTREKTAGIVETWDNDGGTAVVLGSGDESGQAVSMGANVRGGVLGLFRDGKQHLLDPLELDELKAALER